MRSLMLCGKVLLPSLFPFFAVSSLLLTTGTADLLSAWLGKPFEALFRLPPACVTPFLLGAIGGYPVGARSVASLLARGSCTRAQGERLLSFCNNAGPAFVIGALGGGLLADSAAGLWLYGIHLLSAMIIGFLFRGKEKPHKGFPLSDRHPSQGLLASFLSAVSESVPAFLNVCAYVVLFGIVISMLRAVPLFQDAGPLPALVLGSLELTTGAAMLCSMKLPPGVLYPALSFLLGWGGLSVQLQSLSMIASSGIPSRSYLAAKLLQGTLAAVITLFCTPFLQG